MCNTPAWVIDHACNLSEISDLHFQLSISSHHASPSVLHAAWTGIGGPITWQNRPIIPPVDSRCYDYVLDYSLSRPVIHRSFVIALVLLTTHEINFYVCIRLFIFKPCRSSVFLPRTAFTRIYHGLSLIWTQNHTLFIHFYPMIHQSFPLTLYSRQYNITVLLELHNKSTPYLSINQTLSPFSPTAKNALNAS